MFIHELDRALINRIIMLTMSRDKPIHANANAAVLIHFLPLDAFLSSDHHERTKKPQYIM